MRLEVLQHGAAQHKSFVTGLGWSMNGDLISVSEDKVATRWNMNAEPQGEVCVFEAFPTDLSCFPPTSNRTQADCFLVAFSDGHFGMYNKSGKMEWRSVDEAHVGAVVKARWSHDGTAIATVGEDGIVKIWSRTGQLRSKLAAAGRCVYDVAWSPDGDKLAFVCGTEIMIKPLQPNSKDSTFHAGERTILSLDWSATSGLLVTGGEDGTVRVWDSFGRAVGSTPPGPHPVTAVKWSGRGDLVAAGSFESLILADKAGRQLSRHHVNGGSVLCLSWTVDGTMVCGGTARGDVVFAAAVGKADRWGAVEAEVVEPCKVRLSDAAAELEEVLEFRDRVVTLSLGWGWLIVATSTQVLVHSLSSLNTPVIFDAKDVILFAQPSEKYFLLADATNGLTAYNYDGRVVCSLKFPGLRSEMLDAATVSSSVDVVATVDHANPKLVRICDAATGKSLGEPVKHGVDVAFVTLNTTGGAQSRKIAFIDRNGDLFLAAVGQAAGGKAPKAFKLASLCDTAAWGVESDILAAVADGRFLVWNYPGVVFVDQDLLEDTRVVRDVGPIGKLAKIVGFHGMQCSLRRADGAYIHVAVSPLPAKLHELVRRNQWEGAIQLCRQTKDRGLWATLAGMAVAERELNTAEVAFAAIDEVAKLEFVQYIKEIPTPEGRNAELALWRRNTEEAEKIFIRDTFASVTLGGQLLTARRLQAGLTYRAVRMHIRLYNWDRALEIAQSHKKHVDTVIAYRQRYLEQLGKEETLPRFQALAGKVTVDWDAIARSIQLEKEAEAKRPGARPYGE